MNNSRKQRFLALASRDPRRSHADSPASQLTTSPSLPLSWPRPISSKPEPSRTALISGLQAHTDSQLPTHGPSHAHYRSQTRRHALPLHTCSNTAPPKHSPAQSSHGPPFGSRGSPTAAAPLGSFQCVSCTPRQRCSRELQRPPRRVLKPEPRIPCSWVREPAAHPVTAAGWATSAPCTPLPSGVGEIQAQRPAGGHQRHVRRPRICCSSS